MQAWVNAVRSVYNDNWCTYLSSQMHEVGHNIDLAHSGEGTAEYADQSGMMGYSYSQDEGPVMCFNNAKMWQLGWYSDRHFEWTGTSTSVELVGISEYTAAGSGQQIVVRIAGGLSSIQSSSDYYIGFNRKTGINSGTVEGGNQVTIQTKPAGTPSSYVTPACPLNTSARGQCKQCSVIVALWCRHKTLRLI
jgi:hypothetical protein